MPEQPGKKEDRNVEGKTSHAEQRSQESQAGDPQRQVGDVNRVVREGRRFRDTETGYDVYVDGDRVVIVDPASNQQITQFKNSRANTQNESNPVGGNRYRKIMFKAIDVWKRLDDTTAIRYRCFQHLADGRFVVQSADYYYLPIREEQIRALDRQFLELFLEEAPDQRSSLHSTLEDAIAMYDLEFSNDRSTSSERKTA